MASVPRTGGQAGRVHGRYQGVAETRPAGRSFTVIATVLMAILVAIAVFAVLVARQASGERRDADAEGAAPVAVVVAPPGR